MSTNIFDLLKFADAKKKAPKPKKEGTPKPKNVQTTTKTEAPKKPVEAKPKHKTVGATGPVLDDRGNVVRAAQGQTKPSTPKPVEKVTTPAPTTQKPKGPKQQPVSHEQVVSSNVVVNKEARHDKDRHQKTAPPSRGREFDRHQSGTGRLANETKKGGHGKGNVGKPGEEYSVASPPSYPKKSTFKDFSKPEEKKKKEEVAPEVTEKKEEVAPTTPTTPQPTETTPATTEEKKDAEKTEEKPVEKKEEDNTVSFGDFLKKKQDNAFNKKKQPKEKKATQPKEQSAAANLVAFSTAGPRGGYRTQTKEGPSRVDLKDTSAFPTLGSQK